MAINDHFSHSSSNLVGFSRDSILTPEKARTINELTKYFSSRKKELVIGKHKFSFTDLEGAKYIDHGTMNSIFVMKCLGLVLKWGKQDVGVLGESYEDIQKQIALFRRFQEEHPEIAFHIPETQVVRSATDPDRFVIISEYIEGRHLRMKDVYEDPEIQKQVLDLAKAFKVFMKNYRYPIALDLMGASQGVACALFALGLKKDFELANIIVSKDQDGKKRLVLVDTGLALGTSTSALKLVTNLASSIGQFLTMYHMEVIASGKRDESLIC